MSTQATKLVTAEELLAMGDIGRCELVRGEIIMMSPAGAEHGDVAGELFRRIANFVRENKLGKVYAAETGFTIARNPDTTRAPDVAFVRKERVPPRGRRGFFEGAPDLVVEVISFNDLASEAAQTVDEWLRAGATSVWTVDPRTRTVHVYRQNGEVLRLREQDELRDDRVLPGFRFNISDLFADTE